MTQPAPISPNDTVIGKIRITDDQQLHLRRRELGGEIPPFLDLAQFNTQGGGYRLATPFPDDPRVVRQIISLLQHHLETTHGNA
ncbi:hypothetical protein ACFYP4_02545 [Streptomyces sp. NPDC005551]|uniref:hypothetical protein n=1 Tax=Streptomyces sp. NPDC005551 TaxID=3364725 RepID=UPI0036806E9D